MVEFIGLVAVFIAIFSFGSYFAPVRKLKNPNLLFYHSTMGIGNFITVIITVLLFGFSFNLSFYGLFAGLVWTAGNFTSILAVKRGGLARIHPTFSSINALTSFLIGVLFFKETVALYLSVLGIVLLLIGIYLISSTREKKKGDLISLLLAVMTGVFFALVGSVFKLSQLLPGDFIFSMAVSILLTSFAVLILRRNVIRKHEIMSGLFSGGLFSIGNTSAMFAILYLGIAVGLPLTQVSLLVGASWGLFYFREHKTKHDLLRILLGSIIVILAATMLAFSI